MPAKLAHAGKSAPLLYIYIYMYINCMHVPWLEKLELCNVLIAGRSNQKHIYIYIYIVYISVFYVAFRAPIVLLRA